MTTEEKFVWIPSRGHKMAGMIHRPQGAGPYPAVTMLHGFTGNRIEAHRLFVKAARRWVNHVGVAVLRFDFLGSGESDGDFGKVTPSTEIDDALTALGWFRDQTFVDSERVALVGLSMGGLVAACTAARDGRVKVLSLWAAVASMKELWNQRMDAVSKKTLDEEGFLDWGGWSVSRSFFEDALQVDPLREIRGFDGATLIVHGTEDAVVPVNHAHQYYSSVREPKYLHLVAGADHTFARNDWENEVLSVTEEWLIRHL